MALIPQQDILTIQGTDAIQQLKAQLDAYPPVRIVTLTSYVQLGQLTLVAVIETV